MHLKDLWRKRTFHDREDSVKYALLAVAGLFAVTVNAHAFEQNDLDKLKATGNCERCD